MTEIIYTDELKFGEASLPVHLASDRQVYVQLGDLCNLIGVDPTGMAYRVQRDISTTDLLVFMTVPIDDPQVQKPAKAAFLNLAALPYWLGMVSSTSMQRRKVHDQLARYSFDFLDTSWMFYRAAAKDLDRSGIMQTVIVHKANRKHSAKARASL